jgi:hypothetical protein
VHINAIKVSYYYRTLRDTLIILAVIALSVIALSVIALFIFALFTLFTHRPLHPSSDAGFLTQINRRKPLRGTLTSLAAGLLKVIDQVLSF